MGGRKISKDTLMLDVSVALTLIAFGVQKMFEKYISNTNISCTLQALAYTLVVAFVFYVLYTTKDKLRGLVVASFSFAVLPPRIEMLPQDDVKVAIVYYLVRKAAAILFLYVIYRIYKTQKDIKLVPIVIVLGALPFMDQIAYNFQEYVSRTYDSTMLPHLIAAIAYAVAFGLMILAALYYKGESAKYITSYGMLLVCFELLRKAVTIMVRTIAGMYIGKSWPCWILYYAVVLVLFAVVRKSTQKKIEE